MRNHLKIAAVFATATAALGMGVQPAQAVTSFKESHVKTMCLAGNSDGVCDSPLDIRTTIVYRPTTSAPGVWATDLYARGANDKVNWLNAFNAGTFESWTNGYDPILHPKASEYHLADLGRRVVYGGKTAHWKLSQGIREHNDMHVSYVFNMDIPPKSHHVTSPVFAALLSRCGCK